MNNAPDWISRGLSRLRSPPAPIVESPTKPSTKANAQTKVDAQVKDSAKVDAKDKAENKDKAKAVAAAPRSTHERLQATLRRGQEAMAPHVLRRVLGELQAVIQPRTSDVEGGRRAQALAQWYAQASGEERRDLWLLMCEQFAPDAERFEAARQRFQAAAGTAEEGQAEIGMRLALVSPRTRLLQRFAVFPDGMRFLLDLRAELLIHLKSDPRLLALDTELEHLFSTWFDVGFLELRRLSWDSPASLLEKLIQYEAVHDIRSWADLKNRLDSDRRCYALFHPRLPQEPLIFVEVALVANLSDSIAPLLDETAAPADLAKASTAIFYSISNTQAGLRGVGFGDSLIKHVVETLCAEFPRLRTFATLSPIPGLRVWLTKNAQSMLDQLGEKTRAELARDLGVEAVEPEQLLAAFEGAPTLNTKSPVRAALMQCTAHYLVHATSRGKPADPVARFHLGNGARVEQLNWAGDPSAKGHRQSYGLMVNYLYDLKRLDKHRSLLAQGKVAASKEVESLCPR